MPGAAARSRTTGIAIGVGVRAKAQQLGLVETHFNVAAQHECRIQLGAGFFATPRVVVNSCARAPSNSVMNTINPAPRTVFTTSVARAT